MENMLPQFCNNHDWNKQLSSIINDKVLNIGEERVLKLYELFDRFYSVTNDLVYEEHEKFIFDVNSDLIPSFEYYKAESQLEYIGIDLPVYLNYAEGQVKIMIVAVDPLRSEEHLCHKISVGTMFGIHDHKVRTRTRYWQLIETLSRQYTVYLTDTFKLFFYDSIDCKLDKFRSYNQRTFTNPELFGHPDIHQITFQMEVELVQPDLIVTIGKHPRLWFTKWKHKAKYDELLKSSMANHKFLYYNSIPVLPLMHLSGRNGNKAAQIYGVGIKELADEYANLIKLRLSV